MKAFNYTELVSMADGEGGFTLSLNDTKAITNKSGFMVSHSEGESIVSLDDIDGISRAVKNIQAAWSMSQNPDGWFLGGWVNDGNLFIDLSQQIMSLDRAMVAAVQRDQLAIFDLESESEIITTGV